MTRRAIVSFPPPTKGGKRGGSKRTVDSTHLLRYHDGRGTIVCAPDPRNGKAVPQAGEVASATGLLLLLLVDDVGVVKVPRGNDGMGSETQHGAEPLVVLVVLHEPPRRLGAEEDAQHEDKGRDEGRAELQAPGVVAHVLDNDVGREAQEDACGQKGVLATWLVTRGGDNNNNDDGRRARRTGHDPELPEHDEGAASPGRGHLGRVDGHRGVLGADADAHDEPGGEEALPRLGKGRPDGRCRETGGRDEDLASAA